jgi:hypothetical protein
MKKFFTAVNIENGSFVAVVHDTNTNQEIYRTKPHISQSNALQEVNKFITNQKSIQPTAPSQQTIINSTAYTSTGPAQSSTTRRCCGR